MNIPKFFLKVIIVKKLCNYKNNTLCEHTKVLPESYNSWKIYFDITLMLKITKIPNFPANTFKQDVDNTQYDFFESSSFNKK